MKGLLNMKFPLKKWIKEHKTAAISILCAVVLLILFPVVIGGLTLNTQTAFPRPEITPEDWMRQSRMVMKGMQQIMQSDPSQMQEMVITPAEASTLLKFVVNNDQFGAFFSGKSVQEGVLWTAAYTDNGHVQAAYIAHTGLGKLSCILQVNAIVSYADNSFRIIPVECKAGYLVIPNSIVSKYILPKVLEALENNSYVQMFHNAVESISRDGKNRIVIRYIPENAKFIATSLF